MEKVEDYDVVVLGSGFAGGITAVCLGQMGIKTLVVEKKVHPRFVIGESTTPLTTMDMIKLGKEFEVPELTNVSGYLGMRSLGLVTYPKEVFWFGFHYAGKKLEVNDETIAITLQPPLGPDSHMLRSDVDHFLTTLYPKYNVAYTDNTAVDDFEMNDKCVNMKLHVYKKDDREESEKRVRCKFVVDCSGHNCFLARKYGLHDHDATLRHRSRTIYAHFKKPPGWDLDNVCGGRNPYIHTRRDNGTMHHFFEGGWIWIIPFENDTISIGIVLDLDLFPQDNALSAKEEWDMIIARYPTIQAHLAGLETIKPLIRFGRIQITSSTILGDRFILSPHAASFIDPLYSTGMSLTTRFSRRLLRRIKDVIAADTPAQIRQILLPMEIDFQKEVDQIDKLVGGSFAATHHNLLFRQYWRLWITSALGTLLRTKENCAPLFCAFDPAYVKAVDDCYDIVMNYAKKVRTEHRRLHGTEKPAVYKEMHVDEAEVFEIATKLKEIVDARLEALNDSLSVDMMPAFSVAATEPVISPGGICSENQMDFVLGTNRSRVLSFFLSVYDFLMVQVAWCGGKILGDWYPYGRDIEKLYRVHQIGPKVRRTTPIPIIKRLWARWTNQKMT